MEDLGFTAIPAITVICYLIARAVKATTIDNKWLPVICGVAGGLLGATALHVMQDYPASDPITAAAIGIVSGLAATGFHQIIKQMGGGPGCP
ncbi:MAG: phage holin family protein [Intestinibacillus sp.]